MTQTVTHLDRDPVTPDRDQPPVNTGIERARLTLSDDLVIESRSESGVVLVNLATAARMQLSLSAYTFLKSFATPRQLDEVASPAVVARLLPQIRRLMDRHMLIDADAPEAAPERRRIAVAYRFCGAPAFSASNRPDFVVLGAPYDLAGTVDCRSAPGLIRQKSLEFPYRIGLDDGRPLGWFDVDRASWILREASFADAGDIPVDYGESRDGYAARVAAALAECRGSASVPVVLGGDRSVTAAVLRGSRRAPVQLVEVTARQERSVAEGQELLQAGNGIVERLIGVDPDLLLRPDAAATTRAQLATDCPAHLSVDLMIASGPVSLGALKHLIAAVADGGRIASIDLVGLDTRSQTRDLIAAIACHIALTAMGSIHAGR